MPWPPGTCLAWDRIQCTKKWVNPNELLEASELVECPVTIVLPAWLKINLEKFVT